MVVKYKGPQSRSAIKRARRQMQRDFENALPVLAKIDYQSRFHFFTEHLENLCWSKGKDFNYTSLEVSRLMQLDERYSSPTYLYHLDFPEVEQEVIAMRTLSQGSGGVYNSAINRKRTSAKGYAVPIEAIPLTQRRFLRTVESQYCRERLEASRAFFGDSVPQSRY